MYFSSEKWLLQCDRKQCSTVYTFQSILSAFPQVKATAWFSNTHGLFISGFLPLSARKVSPKTSRVATNQGQVTPLDYLRALQSTDSRPFPYDILLETFPESETLENDQASELIPAAYNHGQPELEATSQQEQKLQKIQAVDGTEISGPEQAGQAKVQPSQGSQSVCKAPLPIIVGIPPLQLPPLRSQQASEGTARSASFPGPFVILIFCLSTFHHDSVQEYTFGFTL